MIAICNSMNDEGSDGGFGFWCTVCTVCVNWRVCCLCMCMYVQWCVMRNTRAFGTFIGLVFQLDNSMDDNTQENEGNKTNHGAKTH